MGQRKVGKCLNIHIWLKNQELKEKIIRFCNINKDRLVAELINASGSHPGNVG